MLVDAGLEEDAEQRLELARVARAQQLEELVLVPLPELLLDEVRTGVPELAARRDVDDATRGAGGRVGLARVLAPQRVEEVALEPASLTR